MIDVNEILKGVNEQFKGMDFEKLKGESEKAMELAFEKALQPINDKLDKITKHLGIE